VRRFAVAVALLALLLPQAAQATTLRAVGICGPERCLASTRPNLLRELAAVLDSSPPSQPRPPDSEFYLVDMLSSKGGGLGKAAFLPESSILYWRPHAGDERWIALSSNAAALMRAGSVGAAPYEPPLTPVLGIASTSSSSGGGTSPWLAVAGAVALAVLAAGSFQLVRRQRGRARHSVSSSASRSG
jgi:hypothetical protein